MHITDLDLYAKLLKEKSGLIVSQDKAYLLESRLSPVAKSWGFETLSAMTQTLHGVPDAKLVEDIVEAMTTNETSFFRDTRPFDMFRDHLLTYMKDARKVQKRVRIWCAAASSGQEPYTLAMVIKELAAEYPGWQFTITATDISNDILEQAKAGVYSQFEVQRGLPIQLLMKYFTQNGQSWQVCDALKSMISYRQFNLLHSMSGLGTFDIIFCRNVLIYFDEPTKGTVLANMARQLEPDGFLVLGGAETVIGITDAFAPVPNQRGAYGLVGGPHLKKPEEGMPPTAAAAIGSGT
ncbi:MAG: CheR family methyltransferase [Bdellovibrionales bacterium]